MLATGLGDLKVPKYLKARLRVQSILKVMMTMMATMLRRRHPGARGIFIQRRWLRDLGKSRTKVSKLSNKFYLQVEAIHFLPSEVSLISELPI